jgi:hypothetical protein
VVTTACLGALTNSEIPSSTKHQTPVVPTAGDVDDTDKAYIFKALSGFPCNLIEAPNIQRKEHMEQRHFI